METNTKSKTIQKRIKSNKEGILEQLEKTPIVQLVCSRAGVGRATYYRWRKKDKGFTQKADEAILKGRLLINDLAESQLLSAIREQNMTAIIFWLKHNHEMYRNRLELTQKSDEEAKLSKKQREIIRKALLLINTNQQPEKNEEKKSKAKKHQSVKRENLKR